MEMIIIHFGHLVIGLSYTTFEYSNLKISSQEITENEELIVKIDVKNTGNRAGKEVVQLYLTDMFGSVTRPNKQLKAFEKVCLNPGEVKTIEFKLTNSNYRLLVRIINELLNLVILKLQ